MEIFFQVAFKEENLKIYSKGIPTVLVNAKLLIWPSCNLFVCLWSLSYALCLLFTCWGALCSAVCSPNHNTTNVHFSYFFLHNTFAKRPDCVQTYSCCFKHSKPTMPCHYCLHKKMFYLAFVPFH